MWVRKSYLRLDLDHRVTRLVFRHRRMGAEFIGLFSRPGPILDRSFFCPPVVLPLDVWQAPGA